MQSNYFQISSILLLFKKAWAKFTESISNTFLMILIPVGIYFFQTFLTYVGYFLFIPDVFADPNNTDIILQNIISYAIGIPMSYFYMAYFRAILNATKDMKKVFSIANFYSLSLITWIKAHVAVIIIYFISALGFIFFILPGFYLFIRLSFVVCILYDKPSLGIFSAISQSWKLTSSFEKGKSQFKNHLLHILGIYLFMIAYTFVIFSGFLLCGVGLVFTIPFGYLMYLYLYRHLNDQVFKLESITTK